MIRALVFDLDGTLIDSMPDITAAVNEVLLGEGFEPLDIKTVTGFVGNGLPKLMECVIGHTGLPMSDHARLTEAVLALYMSGDGTLTTIYPHVVETLESLQTAGFAMGICTNKPEGAARVILDQLDLTRFFDVIIGGDTLPTRKPDPAMMLQAFEALGVRRGLYVGDSEVDAETARAGDMPFALFTQGYRKTEVAHIPHTVAFSDFAELPAIAGQH